MARFIISQDLLTTLRTWANLLRSLDFPGNIKGYEWEGEIVAGEVVSITHGLKVTPSRFVVTDCSIGSSPVIRADTPKATSQFFYVTSAGNFRGKLLILP